LSHCGEPVPESLPWLLLSTPFQCAPPRQAAAGPASNRWRNTDRGAVIRRYSFGRRFTTRGSTRLGRYGLTSIFDGFVASLADLSHRRASMKLRRINAAIHGRIAFDSAVN
jgi:hypothetical protein